MTNIKQFPKKDAKKELPDNCKETEVIHLQEVLFSDEKTKTVTDFTTGEQRNRRWGVVLSFSIFPKFDEMPPNQAPMLLPKSPTRFIAGDTIDDIRARVLFELDRALSMAKLSVEDPAAFQKAAMEHISKAGQNIEDDMN